MRLKRHNKELEQWLDQHYVRCGRDLYWIPHGRLWELENTDSGECNVVGKGPSLDTLTDFGNQATTFCINESIERIESLDLPNKLFSVRQDPPKGRFYLPQKATVITRHAQAKLYKGKLEPYFVNPMEVGLNHNVLTVLLVIQIAKLIGYTKANMFCFDSIRGVTEYARCVGLRAESGGNPTRFLGHAKKVLKTAGDMEIVWK